MPDALITDHRSPITDHRSVPVWSYWTGPQPAWIGICLDTLRRHCPTAQVLDDSVWTSDYDGEIPPEDILRQLPNVRSDILRVWLMLRRGGVWVDADCIVFRDLQPIAEQLRNGRTWVAYHAPHTKHLCSALIASRPGSPIAADYWKRIVAALTPGTVLPTLAVGPTEMMVRAIKAVGRQHVHWLDGHKVQPISWRRARRLLRPDPFIPAPDSWTFMLGHSQLGHAAGWDRERILQADMLISRLFRRALGPQPPITPITPLAPISVYSYWTGPQPPWIGICLDTLRQHCPTAQILDDSIWTSDYDGEIPAPWIRRQAPAVQADILRAWLLHRRGGIWVDADCVVFRDLAPIAAALTNADYVTYRLARPPEPTNALLAATPGSLIAARYWELICRRCAARGRLPRTALGPRLLEQAILAAPDRCHYLPPRLVQPIHHARRHQFRRRRERPIPADAYCCMLVHTALGPLAAQSREALLSADVLISRVFRRALSL